MLGVVWFYFLLLNQPIFMLLQGWYIAGFSCIIPLWNHSLFKKYILLSASEPALLSVHAMCCGSAVFSLQCRGLSTPYCTGLHPACGLAFVLVFHPWSETACVWECKISQTGSQVRLRKQFRANDLMTLFYSNRTPQTTWWWSPLFTKGCGQD